MPRSAQNTRQKILQEAHRLFRRQGFFRTGTEEIAAASQVTKRTLYHHFESKDALLAAVLSARHEEIINVALPYGIELRGTPEQIVEALFAELVAWSGTAHWSGSGFTRVAMELADLRGHPARSIAHAHKAAMENYVGDVLAAAGVASARERARELFVLMEGAMALILIHGDSSYAIAAANAAKRLFEPVAQSERAEEPASA
jgi:AcrR family transcriptional regulator